MQRRTQHVHKHALETRNKPYTKHTHKTHARNAETHRTDSRKVMKIPPKEHTSTQQVHKKKGEIHEYDAQTMRNSHTARTKRM